MKKLLSMLLAGLLLLSTALAEGMLPVNTPITIDGVRVAFFDAEGNYLQTMEKNGLLWVPLNALCEKGWIVPLPGSGRKKEYKLTDKGLTVLKNELNRLRQLVEQGESILKEEQI